jgi:hypothetical protein
VFTDDINRRIMDFVGIYRRSRPGRILRSYETIVRAATVLTLRELNIPFSLLRVVTRFDGKRAPVVKLLADMSKAIPVHIGLANNHDTISRHVEDIMEFFQTTPGRESTVCLTPASVSRRAIALWEGMHELGYYVNEHVTISQAIACTTFVIKFCPEAPAAAQSVTLRECMRASRFGGSEKSCYREFATLRGVAREANPRASEPERVLMMDSEEGFLKVVEAHRLKGRINSLLKRLD